MRIGIIHATPNAVQPLNEAFSQLAPDFTIFNFVDEYLQYYANQINGIDETVYQEFVRLAVRAQQAQVDFIVVACTVLTPIVDVVKPFVNIPVIAVDRPMLEAAVSGYEKIGIVATNAPSGPATREQLIQLAKELNKEINVFVEIDVEAMKQLKLGNINEHNTLNALAAQKLKEKGAECIILAQVTQASAEETVKQFTNLKVLTSPKEAVKKILSNHKLGDELK
ncbi:aspartate/glutamate racemase family protein [Chryseomicrobium palamuruense]|uniref:Aspartate/glutamate racemase family protein n=1 Tax=Chryseomicrobium palamuruense TaxID=682973 RepID=A0ABV8UTA4_9BACL